MRRALFSLALLVAEWTNSPRVIRIALRLGRPPEARRAP